MLHPRVVGHLTIPFFFSFSHDDYRLLNSIRRSRFLQDLRWQVIAGSALRHPEDPVLLPRRCQVYGLFFILPWTTLPVPVLEQ